MTRGPLVKLALTVQRRHIARQWIRGTIFTLLAALPVALAACSGSTKAASTTSTQAGTGHTPAAKATPAVDYGKAAIQLVSYDEAGQWGLSYAHLATQQQALVTRQQFEVCMDKTHVPSLGALAVVKTYSDPLMIPGTQTTVPFEAVTLKSATLGNETTVHIWDDAGTWRWILSDPQDYANGNCPAS